MEERREVPRELVTADTGKGTGKCAVPSQPLLHPSHSNGRTDGRTEGRRERGRRTGGRGELLYDLGSSLLVLLYTV